LETKFNNALNGNSAARPAQKSAAEQLASTLQETSRPRIEQKEPVKAKAAPEPVSSEMGSDEADLEDYFKKLASE
jgi:hypothetical protein